MIFTPSSRYSDGRTSKSSHVTPSSTTASFESPTFMMIRGSSNSGARGSGVVSSSSGAAAAGASSNGGQHHLYQDYYTHGYSGHGYYDDDDYTPVTTHDIMCTCMLYIVL